MHSSEKDAYFVDGETFCARRIIFYELFPAGLAQVLAQKLKPNA